MALLIWLTAISTLSVFRLATSTEPVIAWLGALLASAAPLSWFVISHRSQQSRSPHPLGYTIGSCLGLSMSMTAAWRYGPAIDSIHILAGLSLISWVIYLRWFRNEPEATGK